MVQIRKNKDSLKQDEILLPGSEACIIKSKHSIPIFLTTFNDKCLNIISLLIFLMPFHYVFMKKLLQSLTAGTCIVHSGFALPVFLTYKWLHKHFQGVRQSASDLTCLLSSQNLCEKGRFLLISSILMLLFLCSLLLLL